MSLPDATAEPTAPLSPDARPAPSLRDLFVGFLSVAVVAFGGVLPIARRAVVERYQWVSPEEFVELVGLAQFLPGPNIVNLAVVIGGRFRGPVGALVAVLGLTLVPMAIVITLGALFTRYADVAILRDVLAGLAAAAAGLVLAMAGRMAETIWRRPTVHAAAVAFAAYGAVAGLGLPLVPVMLTIAPVSVALAWWQIARAARKSGAP
ncbi:chromate transporter [Ancylobacter sp. 6x-1]|uniref:Chromate transporter n=1 Tax=Ancylobacter crimeensis TaxID=2579147 RepID=A0ABT0DAG5_9HYPH|nr:chromate transporter [Ancylobacter crimeensis]MCK0196925.1 chromate transporter [Ancylobacter crimeensis]